MIKHGVVPPPAIQPDEASRDAWVPEQRYSVAGPRPPWTIDGQAREGTAPLKHQKLQMHRMQSVHAQLDYWALVPAKD